MTTQYTPILKLALPVTGELSGSWGDTVNDNITSMVEQAVAGLATINTWTTNSHTLTTANGVSSESRCAMLVAATGGGAPTAAATIICPAASKLYILQNNTAYAVTLKTSAGTGVAVAAGNTSFLFCDGTNVNPCVTSIVDGKVTGNLTVDGNATLGDASTDTVQVNGYMGVGGAANAGNALRITSSALTGVGQVGVNSSIVASSASTSGVASFQSTVGTAAAAFTTVYVAGLDVVDAVKGAGSTITNQHGVYIRNQTQGTNNYGVTSLVSSGTNKFNIYASGTADNYFAGNVGIGTTTPSGLLHLSGNTAATTAPTIVLQDSGVASTRLGTITNDNGDLVLAMTASFTDLRSAITLFDDRKITFTTNASERMRLDSSGNLLLGTTSTRTFAGITSALQVESTTVNGGSQFLTVNNATAGNGPLFSFNRSRGTALGDVTAVAQGDTLGRVFFAGADGTNLISAASISSQVDATPGTNDMPGRLIFSTTADGASTVTERMRIDSAGNVGIGATSPTSRLFVAESANNDAGTPTAWLEKSGSATTTAGNQVLAIEARATTSGYQTNTEANIGFYAGRTGAQADNVHISSIGSILTSGTSGSNHNGAVIVSTAAAGAAPAERMRIDSAGNVGIGTSSPSANLEISNAGNATLRLTAGNTSSSIIQLGDTDDGNVGEITYSHSTNSMAFDTNDVERMRIDSSGNLLVGTTSNASTQGAPLQVITAMAARRNIANVGGPAFRMEKSRATTDGTYTIVANGDTLGDYQFFGADGAQYIIGASVKAEVDAAPSLNVMPTALVFSTENSAGTYAERMRLDSSGNVGIGNTPSGTYKLEVTGGFSATGNAVLGDATTDTVTVNGYMGVGGAGDAGEGLRISNSALTGTTQTGLRVSATGSSAATSVIRSITTIPQTAATAFTVTNVYGLLAQDAIKGAGSTITNQTGILVSDQTQGTNNYGITSAVTSGTNKFNIYASGTASNYFAGTVQFAAGTAALPALTRFGDENTGMWFPAADTIAFSEGGAEAMRIDSSGRLLVGLTSTNTAFGGKLQVEGTSDAFASLIRYSSSSGGAPAFYLGRSKSATLGTNTIVASADTLGSLVFTGANGTGYSDAASIQGFVDGTPGASADMPGRLVFSTSADGSATPTERMRIDSSGNVGIGVTPSAWSSFKALQVGAGTVLYNNSNANGSFFGSNFYWNGSNNIYIGTSTATAYGQTGGLHQWFIAPSGTAGNTVSFTQAMTLNASGQLTVGNTATAFDSTSYAVVGSGTGDSALTIYTSTATAGYLQFADGTSGAEEYRGFIKYDHSTNAMSFSTNSAARTDAEVTIDSSGNVGIGTTSPGAILHTIKTSAGATTVGAFIQNSDNTVGTEVRLGFAANTNVVSSDRYAWIGHVNTGGTNGGALTFATTPGGTSATERMRIDSSGNVLVTSAAGLGYGTGSGGTVTQATSKSTAVTLNKPTGQITMNNAALGAGTSVIFALLNSLIAATDTVILSHSATAGTANAYVTQALTCGAGSVTIRVTNITAGSLSEAAIINFSIIKGATS